MSATQQTNTPTDTEAPWKNEDTLRELYHGERMSQSEIAEELGCSIATISYWMDKHGIDTRSVYQANLKNYVTYRQVPSGHKQWSHYYKGERSTVYVHRLLAYAEGYSLEELDGNHVHHKNGCAWDNRPSNIEVLTPREHHCKHIGEVYKWIISHIEENGPACVNELCDRFDRSQPTMQGKLDYLMDIGFLKRYKDPDNGLQYLYDFTEEYEYDGCQ